MKNHQYINSSSGNVEFFTPAPIIEAARLTLGRIDLDPASSVLANEHVGATHFFTESDDGLRQCWGSMADPLTVWMNMPFRRKTNAQWINKFISEFECGNVSSALCITFASTSEKWFRPLLAHPQAYLSPRTNYLLPDGSTMRGVTKGSVVTLLTDSMKVLARFRTHFSPLGVVKV